MSPCDTGKEVIVGLATGMMYQCFGQFLMTGLIIAQKLKI